jgi:hypothetical protein
LSAELRERWKSAYSSGNAFALLVGIIKLKRYTSGMELTVTLTSFELGQLYAALGVSGLNKLSPELRRKLKDAFKQEPPQLATEEPPA